jgi:hypothetical protein
MTPPENTYRIVPNPPPPDCEPGKQLPEPPAPTPPPATPPLPQTPKVENIDE